MPTENDDLLDGLDFDFSDFDTSDFELHVPPATAEPQAETLRYVLPELTPGEFYIGGPGDGTAFLEAMLMHIKEEYRATGCGIFTAEVKWRHHANLAPVHINAFCRSIRSAAHRLRLAVPSTPMFYVTLLKFQINSKNSATITMARMNTTVYAQFESRRASDRFNKQFAQRKSNMLDAL